ncbi:phosphatases II [Glonium stellatum]|uniref:Phosphatases II n=1 Tax=Glonium stellatum TaxID=574774 RepID=A0A8E2EZW5_9PEZI|nr:phosphatases II [Glonium stellatum]
MVQLAALCGLIPALWCFSQRARQKKGRRTPNGSISDASDANGVDAVTTDPGLLKKHSTIKAYTIPATKFTYPAIRTFYRPHPQGEKLPSTPTPVPLLVFIHGLGGSVAQFHPLLVSLVNLAPCLGIDLPGCGVSTFAPKSWEAYTTDSLVHLLAIVIEQHRDKIQGQGIILVGHSMGCSLAALLASSSSPYAHLVSDHVLGLIAICPNAEPPSLEDATKFKKLLAIPGPVFDLWRKWDRRGGTESASVARFVGPGAEQETKKLQVRFNEQSKTAVWRRMARGCLPDYRNGTPQGGLPGKHVWAGLNMPVFLAAGEADHVTPPSEMRKIAAFLGRTVSENLETPKTIPDSAAPTDSTTAQSSIIDSKESDSATEIEELKEVSCSDLSSCSSTSLTAKTSDFGELDPAITATTISPVSTAHIPEPLPRRLVLKTTIFPHPASHALLYAPSTSRTLAGLIGTFIATHIDARLSLGWQLQYLTTEGKWDVKNLAKWKAVKPVSEPIAGVFRAMKTLREVDEQHCPKVFVSEWKGKIKAVVDISHESPVYDPAGLEAGGIAYHKFPTVSKLPPTVDEVGAFITLIDNLRAQPSAASAEAAAAIAQSTSLSIPLSSEEAADVASGTPTSPSTKASTLVLEHAPKTRVSFEGEMDELIGVHCHYGFNRTGFFVVSYLVERLEYKLQDAIDEFRRARPPGIRHEHFVDALFVRYCVGLKRAPTL